MAPRLLGLLVALALRCAGVAAFHAPPITRRAPRHHTRLLAAGDVDDDAEALVLGEADAVATLGLVTALWGSQHAVAKWALGFDGGGAPALTALRFAVAAAVLSPFLPRDAATWRDGLELGAWGFLGFACQTVGLETTTACRSAFLLYLNVKLVPVFELARGAGRETKICNATSTCVYANGFDVCFSLSQKNSPRENDPSKHQSNRLRRDRAREV